MPDDRDDYLVSCLMITTNRLALAQRSIRCFANQTYPRLELVIVCAGDRTYSRAVRQFLDDQEIANARVVAAEPDSTLGSLRNKSLDAARGDIVCQWDDDDCYHPERVARQVEHMITGNAQACFLADNLHLFAADRQMFWVDWARGTRSGDPWLRLFPPSVVRFNDERFRYPESGPSARLGEDLDLAAELCRRASVVTLVGVGWLYLYVFHGANTWPRQHHRAIPAHRSFPDEWIASRAEEIREAANHYPPLGPLDVCGVGGRIFSLA